MVIWENSLLGGGTIDAFGDPVSEGSQIYFPFTLRWSGAVTNSNDQRIAAANIDGTNPRIIAREGTAAAGLSNYNF